MKKDEMTQRIQAIGQMDKIEDIRAGLVTLQTDLETDYDTYNNVSQENEKHKNDIKSLQEKNMELYLQVSKGTKTDDEKSKTEDLKYEDLYDEKGELK